MRSYWIPVRKPGGTSVPVRVAAEPVRDLGGVGGGVAVAVRGGGDLLPRQAGQHRPAAGGERQGLAQGGGHGLLRAGVRGWPQRVVSVISWAARAGRIRAWYSAWADSSPGVRPGWRYRTDHKAQAMSRPYRHRSWASQQ